MKRDHHREYVEERSKRSPRFRRAYRRTLHKVDLAILVAQMREAAGLSQSELAARIGTSQPVIARLENAAYQGQSLKMLEKIAAVCGVTLTLRARRRPDLELEVALI